MNKKYFTVGPTELFPEIADMYAAAAAEGFFSVSHRSKEFEEILEATVNSVTTLLDVPEDFYVFFLSSATECMERIIENTVEKKSFHFINGYFAQRFFDIASLLKKEPAFVKTDFGTGFDFQSTNIPDDTELICVTHNETSTGVALPLEGIYKIKKQHPDKLVAVDIVTSVPYYSMDFTFIDIAFFSVQKGFGLPPGLGIMFVRKSVLEKSKSMQTKGFNIGTYNNFIKLAANADKHQTTMTPNIPAIYLLGKISDLILERGVETMRTETEKKANLIYNFFDKHDTIKPFVKDAELRSKTTIVLETELEIQKVLEKIDYNGFVLSKGYGEYKDKHIRIGNFPVHRQEDVSNLIYLFRKF